MSTDERKLQAALALAAKLAEQRLRLVLVESCTGGSVAGALATIPGISQWLCGSFVVYRNQSKIQWLQIPSSVIDDPSRGPVSPQVTELLARHALAATAEAEVAVAVTGHIGPASPADLDGQVFFALARRSTENNFYARVRHLEAPSPTSPTDYAARHQRLEECTLWVLSQALQALES